MNSKTPSAEDDLQAPVSGLNVGTSSLYGSSTMPGPHKPEALSMQAIRRPELRKIVPLSDTTIYEMEQRGEFPRRFYLTPRCAVWNLAEVEAWITERRRHCDAATAERVPCPDVRQRKVRPVR
jgi:predicted DNA-binding transcriptional regulator AlpA